MKRFHQILYSKVGIRYPSDVKELKLRIPELSHLSDNDVQTLYETYSDTYAAGWMNLDEEMFNEFRSWCLTDVGSNDEKETL